jgi:hypothetical protein
MLKRDRGELSLENSKQQLQNVMKKSKLDESTKNLLYNQQLKRFLKMRNEIANKPIKVELTNGDKILINPGDLINQMQNALKKKKSGRERIRMNAQMYDTDEDNDTEGTISFPAPDAEQTKREEDFAKEGSEEDFKDAEEKPITSTASGTKWQDKKLLIKQIINDNAEKFNVRNEKIIYSNGKPIANSDINSSLDRILNRNLKNAPSPPGTTSLAKRLKNADETKHLMRDIKIPAKETTPRKTRTSIKAGQLGKGVFKKKINKRIKPKKWY